MGRRWACLLLLALAAVPARSQLDYNINTTWNGGEIDHDPIQFTLSGSPDNSFLEIDILAPFFNDQPPPNRNLEYNLWKYEVVEVYFLNDEDQYLQVQLSPHGQYNVYLFNGSRVDIRQELALDYKAETHRNITWNGRARIPVEYLPKNVTKFNAFGMHGSGTNRVYESLYPAPATEPKPNFHALEYFEDIVLDEVMPNLSNADMSELWRESLENYRPPLTYYIESTWNGGQIDHDPIHVELRSSLSGNELELYVVSPFFNKQPAPPVGRPEYDLWKYEVVEAYFLNDKDQYILVQMSPYGHRMVYLYNGSRKYIRSNLPLEYEAQISGTIWKGRARIPVDYLPTDVTRFNAFAIHGLKPNRVHESLYPAPNTELKPNFHVLEYFKPIDLNEIMPGLATAGMSEVWKASLESSELEYRFNITSTWNGGEIDHDPIQFKFSASPKGNFMELSVIAPFFNDLPSPPGISLWKYEVVEAYFLNDDNQYLQVQLSPYGKHVVYLLNGSRTYIRYRLPMEYKAQINGNTWTGNAKIPVEYLPQNVTKFNLFGQHGSKPNRFYESMFPAPSTELKPDFHALEYFKAIDLTRILPGLVNAEMSEIWRDSIEGIFRYRIQTTWNDKYIYHSPAEITLQGFTGGVEMNVTAPFFNDPKPGGETGKPFYGLWDYEVVEMFFLNDDEEYLEVELGPWGEHLLLVLKGARNALKHSLPLDYIVIERTDPSGANPGVWRGSALIPPEYFPPNVNRMNAYAIHGTGDAREYQSLYPAPYGDPDYAQADFHRLELFHPIDFEYLVANNSDYSDFWREAIGSGSASLTTLKEVEVTTSLPVTGEEEEITTLLGPAEGTFFDPTPAPPRPTFTQSGPTPTPIQTSFSHPVQGQVNQPIRHTSPTRSPFRQSNQESFSRIPRPQLVVGNEPREERQKEGVRKRIPGFNQPSRIPQPQRVNLPNDPSIKERRPVQIRRPPVSNQNHFSINDPFPTHGEDQSLASSQIHGQGQTFVTTPLQGGRQPVFPIEEDSFSNHNIRQPDRPSLFDEVAIQSEGQTPFPNQGQFHRQDQPQFVDQGKQPVRNQGRPHLPSRGQVRFQDQGQSHLGNQPFQNQGQTLFADDVQPNTHRQGQLPFPNSEQSFQSHGQEQFANPQLQNQNQPLRQQFPVENPNSPAFTVQSPPRFQEQNRPTIQTQEAVQFERPSGTSQSVGFQPENQVFEEEQQSVDLPGSETSGGQSIASPEVEQAVITLAEGSPALPPPHPVCFELGLVPDPQRCFVFHECVLEGGEWQMYSWRCQRGQVTKFNAFGMHGPQINRVNESLYPAPTTEPKPNLPPLIHLIESTWNGGQIDHEPIRVELRSSLSGNELELIVEAPFFNKQPAPPQGGRPVFDLWKYEVVEAYFLNDKNHYICVQMSPYGQYRVYLYNGSRKYIRSNLPLEYGAQISGTSWESMARIPVEYLPTNVTKFNAFAMHGLKPNRVHESLYPAPITELKPNFHALEYFKPIDFNEIMPGLATAGMSEVWKVSLERPPLIHLIESTWNGGQIDHEPIRVELRSSLSGNELELIVEAPFFNKQPAPPQGGRPVFDLWKYEVVEAYFLNDKNHYICVQMSPYGQYRVYLYNGSRKYIRSNLPLEYEAQIIGTSWESMARIPVEYLPTNVTKFNAFAMHGLKPNRVHESLYPAPITELKPNFHALEYFKPINLNEIMPGLATAGMSEVWKVSLERPPLIHLIESTWNGGQIDHEPIRVELRSSLSGNELELIVEAPFFNKQPAPPQGGRPVFDLWKYEVVEAYFLNDKNHYICVQMSPYGQYRVYLYNGSRKYIRSNLLLKYEAQIIGTSWESMARIPVEYLPANVKKFNAFAMHGLKPNIVHESLYPAPITELKPNFHVLEYFNPIDLTKLMPGLATAGMSEVWKVSLESSELEYRFNITSTWNGGEIDHDPIQFKFSASPKGNFMELSVIAPFFNDQPAPPGISLWKYEVVEAYFLNDDNQYLQVQLSPYGKHVVYLLNGSRTYIRYRLPMEYKAQINGNTWTGNAKIPVEYLPQNVTKFNLFGQHGSKPNRFYESMFPAPSTELKPDFHALQYFKAIDLTRILPGLVNAEMSEIWRDSIEGIFRYRIQTTWNDKYIYHSPAEITLQGFTGGVEMNVTAPFFNDPKPGGETGKPFYGLWDYEVVEMFFLNDDEEYLEVELGPWGEHLLLVLKGARNALKHSLPLDYIVIERTDPSGANPGVWRGSALIPPEYFPPNVNRMNAYAIHGTGDAREYQSLYPAPYGDPDYAQADFHRLELFHPIDFEYLVANNSDYSDFWREAIGSGSTSLTTLNETEEVTTMLPVTTEEEEITTLLGPAEGTFFGPTSAPPRPTFTQSGPTPTPIQTSFSHPVQGQVNQPIRHTSPTRSPFRQSNQESFSRIPRPQLVVGNEPREERQKEGVRKRIPGFNQSSRIPQPQRVNLPNDPSVKERRPVQIRRPSVSNQNHFSINDPFPTHGEDQSLASSQIHGQGQTFVTTPLQGSSFSNPNIRQPDRPSLFDEVTIQSEGQTPFPNQGQFHRQDQPQLVDQGPQPVRNQGRPHLPSRGQVRFQDHQRQSHLGNQPFQNQGQNLFADDVQPNTHRQGQLPFPNSEQSFQSHGQEQIANPQFQNQNQPLIQQLQVENPNSPAFTVQSTPRFQEKNRPAIQSQEAVQFERPSGTSQSVGFQPENQVFEEERESVDLPGSETSGGQSIASPEVEQAVITLAEGSPALPPPHPVCFELGLVPDPQRCFVFHECVLEGGQWQMYSWRRQRGQVFDPVNVACVRGRCPGSRRRRVRRP